MVHYTKRVSVLLLFVLFSGILIFLNGCTRAINRTAERKIREALPDAIGPARIYRVHVDSAPLRTVQGHLSNLTIDGDDVQLPTGLLLDHLHIDLTGVDVDTGRSQIKKIDDARFTLSIREASLDEFIAGEAPPGETIRNPRVFLGDNNIISITAQRHTLGLDVPFRLSGPVRIAGPKQMELDPARLTIVGIPFTGSILNFFKKKIESSVDLSKLSIPLSLTAIRTQRGILTLSGTIDTDSLIQMTRSRK